MKLEAIIKHLRPGVSFRIKRDGTSYEDLEWTDGSPKPTLEEIQAAELPAEKASRIAQIKQEQRSRNFAKYGDGVQMSAALDIYDAAKKNAIKQFISGNRDAANAAEAAVNSLTTVAEVQGFVW